MIGVLLLGFWKLQVIERTSTVRWPSEPRAYIPVIPRGRMLDREGVCSWTIGPPSACSLWMIRRRAKKSCRHLGRAWEFLWTICTTTQNTKNPNSASSSTRASPRTSLHPPNRSDIPSGNDFRVPSVTCGRIFSHPGYVGEVSEQQSSEQWEAPPRRLRGKTGLERQYNDLLKARTACGAWS